jgi:uncharacterized membrane protein YccC
MARFVLTLNQKSFIHALSTFLGALICWYGLTWAGIPNPVWSVITVILVSDPDISAAMKLSKVRSINTIVGCVISLLCLFTLGYSPLICFVTAALTVLIITSILHYPSNWRLAPVTVVIIMNASSLAVTHTDQIRLAVLRTAEIGIGCAVSVAIAAIQFKLLSLIHAEGEQPEEGSGE